MIKTRAQEVTKATTGPKRKALGDITNSVRPDETGKGNVLKKPVLQSAKSANVDLPDTGDVMETDENVVQTISDDRLYMKRPSDNIDARDAGNPLLVTEYVDEMYIHFKELEREHVVNPLYMESQPHINGRMREILIDWLVVAHIKLKMVPETLYTTINFIDRFLEQREVRKSKLQLVGVSALLLAAKYEEIYPPELRDLVYLTDEAYTKQEILQVETDIIVTLDYKCTVPTSHSFLCRYLKAAHADRTMVQLACYLAERSLQEMSMTRFLPSVIAATSILLARKTLKRHSWSPTLLKYTGYDEHELAECAEEMRAYLEPADSVSEQQAVFNKYSGAKFGAVAKCEIVFD